VLRSRCSDGVLLATLSTANSVSATSNGPHPDLTLDPILTLRAGVGVGHRPQRPTQRTRKRDSHLDVFGNTWLGAVSWCCVHAGVEQPRGHTRLCVVGDDGGAHPTPVTALPSRQFHRGQSLALTLAFVAMFASAPGQSFLISVFVDDMLRGTGLSRTVFSVLYALATVVSATVSIALGRATETLGLRLIWLTVAAGLACACVVASVASGIILAFAALALLRAFGQGSFPLLGTLVVNYWFSARRGAAMAAASFGITAATISLPPLVAILIDIVGWRSSYRILAALTLLVVLPLGLLIRRPATTHAAGSAPALPVTDLPMPSAARRSRRLRIAVPRREAALLLAVFAAPPLVMTALTFHAVSLLGGRGLAAPAAAAALSGFGVASAIATLAGGTIVDRLSTRTLLVTMSTVLLVGTLSLLSSAVALAYAGFAIVGFAGGLFGVTSGIAWARTYGTARLGRLQGVSFAAQIAAAAAGPLPLALSLQATGSYRAGLIFLVAVAAAALAGAACWRAPPVMVATNNTAVAP
jgi:MFS family permease